MEIHGRFNGARAVVLARRTRGRLGADGAIGPTGPAGKTGARGSVGKNGKPGAAGSLRVVGKRVRLIGPATNARKCPANTSLIGGGVKILHFGVGAVTVVGSNYPCGQRIWTATGVALSLPGKDIMTVTAYVLCTLRTYLPAGVCAQVSIVRTHSAEIRTAAISSSWSPRTKPARTVI